MILRTLTLSFAVLGRAVLLSPILIIGYVIASIAIGLAVAALAVVFPPFAILIAVIFGAATSSLSMLILIRQGLISAGYAVYGTWKSLIMPSAIYGFVEALGALLIGTIGLAGYIALSPTFAFSDIQLSQDFADRIGAQATFEQDAILLFGAYGLGIIAMAVLRGALLAPMAGAAAGRDPNGQPHTPMNNFGAGLFPMTGLVIVSYLAFPLAIVAVALGVQAVAPAQTIGSLTELESATTPGTYLSFGLSEWVAFGGILLAWLWIFALQSAGAALQFLRSDDGDTPSFAPPEPAEAEPVVDAGALWRSRMQNQT